MSFEYNIIFGELKSYLAQSSKLLQSFLIKSPVFNSGYFNSTLKTSNSKLPTQNS